MGHPVLHSSSTRINKPVDALGYEIAQEMASSLGRLGHTLERSLQALAAFDSTRQSTMSEQTLELRRKLTSEAAHALWQFIVQREACGLRDSRQIMRDYSIPAEVRNRMGVFP